jgi:hypothetical protein
MNNLTDAQEAAIRFNVRWIYNKEGRTDTFTEYPLASIERLVAIDEGQKIEFKEIFGESY